MTLAWGEKSIKDVRTERAPGADGATVIIAVASSTEERVRMASLVTGHAPVLLVSSLEELLPLLVGTAPPVEAPSVHPRVVEPLPRAPVGTADVALEVDSDRRVATWSGRTVPLSPLEHDLLRHLLLTQLGHTCTFESLHRAVWGNDHLGGRGNVRSVVKRLRRKLDELDCPLRIQAVRGVGLRLVTPARCWQRTPKKRERT
ncbi:Transcriptional regulatory protein, C terminal [Micromonospora viridifaciens]|uniref:Transcriptional regulatory protein, C terminal n=1 Tax=Micromonospora viridifaciens TaxID=1881 RepID=A0A1C4ZPQ8_MICVI|nr:winged helix-turn-helix domain-containing protein [Micromonospora viridifaciens]SCF35057.1 Transcriptional regulatory protein, C terminal [Micromonospora viridifaciens]